MSFQLLDTIAGALNQMFGGSLLLLLLIVAVLSLIIFSIKGGKILYFIIIVPMLTTIITFGARSTFFVGLVADSRWIAVAGWLGIGFAVAGIFWAIIR